MGINLGFTAVTGAIYTDAQYNTNVRDNWAAFWVGTQAGDIDYYDSATTKARLAKPSVHSLFANDNSGIPSWIPTANVSCYHTSGYVTFAPDSDSPSTSYTDIPGATLTLTLTATCTILCMFTLMGFLGYPTVGQRVNFRFVIDGVAYDYLQDNYSSVVIRNEIVFGIAMASSIAAGSRICKLQYKTIGNATHCTDGYLGALAFTQP